ncbi:hypothetical protein FACS189492_2660 [Clostridia bacterium]|nr:hypothetical protein FACS189492_2660 [Clostridia bacterium]
MNETIAANRSFLVKHGTDPAKAIEIITKKMLEKRPRSEVALKPYLKSPLYQKGLSGSMVIDFNEIYGDIKEGEEFYVKVFLFAEDEGEIYISHRFFSQIQSEDGVIFSAENTEGFETAPSDTEDADYYFVPVTLHGGYNPFVFKTVCNNGVCRGEFFAAFKRYPLIWSRDYLFSTRAIIGEGYRAGEEGALYKRGESGQWQPNVMPGGDHIDMNKIFPDGNCVYALTYLEKGQAVIRCGSPFSVFLNGREAFRSKGGGEYTVTAYGAVLIKTAPYENRVMTVEGDHAIPFLSGFRNGDIKVILSGSYGHETDDHLNAAYAPERDLQFVTPYPDGRGGYTFWRGDQSETYIRPYLDGIFLGQWFYAVSVGIWGLIESAKAVGDRLTLQYAIDSMRVLSDYFDYANWDFEKFGNPTLLPRGCNLNELDPCGAIGLTIYEAYQLCGDKNMKNVMASLKDAIQNNVPRFDDGTFYRIKTMWSDDTFMSIPLLLRLASLCNDRSFLADAITQADGFHKRLWMDDKKLYSHILFTEQNEANRVPWGRGNGWVMVALSEVLLKLEQTHTAYHRILGYYREFAASIREKQDATGLWHQVLDERASYLETSCTAMFCAALARGIKNGWIDKSYEACVYKAWEALLRVCVDDEGNTYGVCLGSGCAMNARYYYDIPTYKNDDHGTGIILLAAKEILLLMPGFCER